MNVSLRSHVTAGVAALAISSLVVAPTEVTTHRDATPTSTTQVGLAAAVTPLVVEPLRPEQLATARAAIERIDPEAADLLPAALAAPVPLNALSDGIVAGYQWLQGWVDYGVELSQYVLQFIPYGYLIGDQVGIVYYNLVRPIADSVVYDLIVPVVNDPLNLFAYLDGLAAVATTSVIALINTGIAEFNNFFGWLIPPLPPLPFTVRDATSLSLDVTAASTEAARLEQPDTELPAAVEEDVDGTAGADGGTVTGPAEGEAPAPEPPEPGTPAEPQAEAPAEEPTAEAPTTEEPTEKPTAEPVEDDAPTTTTNGTVRAQGEVRGGTTTSTTTPTTTPTTGATTGATTGETTTGKTKVEDVETAAPPAADTQTVTDTKTDTKPDTKPDA